MCCLRRILTVPRITAKESQGKFGRIQIYALRVRATNMSISVRTCLRGLKTTHFLRIVKRQQKETFLYPAARRLGRCPRVEFSNVSQHLSTAVGHKCTKNVAGLNEQSRGVCLRVEASAFPSAGFPT